MCICLACASIIAMHQCKLALISIATGMAKSPPLVRKAESLCCTCKLRPLHCQVAALHELQPVLNRQLINCSNKFSCGAVTWRLTQPGADVCQRLSAPFAACCKGAL